MTGSYFGGFFFVCLDFFALCLAVVAFFFPFSSAHRVAKAL